MRNLVTTERQGYACGTEFDDKPLIQDIGKAQISRIAVEHDDHIVSLTVHYRDQAAGTRRGGGSTGELTEVILSPGEFITIVEGSTLASVISQLRFTTNKGTIWGPYGFYGSHPTFTWNAASKVPVKSAAQMGLLCFSGNSDQYHVRLLQATFAKYPSMEKPDMVKYEKQVGAEIGSVSVVGLSKFARNLMSPIVKLLAGAEKIEFHAYEDILCTLPFFEAALHGRFREAAEKKIHLTEDDPRTLSALIEFLYSGSYTYTYGAAEVGEEGPPASNLSEGSFHAGVYVIASKYDCQPLMAGALRSFKLVLSQLEEMDVLRLCRTADEKGLPMSVWENDDDLKTFAAGLGKLLKKLYEKERVEVEGLLDEHPALATAFLRLVVYNCIAD